MTVLVLIPISIGMGLVGLAAFLWALHHGQFEDPDGNAWRAVLPQDPPGPKEGSPVEPGDKRKAR